jgi:hypothetical protein
MDGVGESPNLVALAGFAVAPLGIILPPGVGLARRLASQGWRRNNQVDAAQHRLQLLASPVREPRPAALRSVISRIYGSLPNPWGRERVYPRRGQASLQGHGVARASGSRRRERFRDRPSRIRLELIAMDALLSRRIGAGIPTSSCGVGSPATIAPRSRPTRTGNPTSSYWTRTLP